MRLDQSTLPGHQVSKVVHLGANDSNRWRVDTTAARRGKFRDPRDHQPLLTPACHSNIRSSNSVRFASRMCASQGAMATKELHSAPRVSWPGPSETRGNYAAWLAPDGAEPLGEKKLI